MKKFTDTQQKSYASRKKRPQKVSFAAVAKMKVKKGDKVKVISGKDKGKTGEIIRVFPKMNKVLIDGVAVAKRHTRGGRNQPGRIAERAMPIHASNVALVEAKAKKA